MKLLLVTTPEDRDYLSFLRPMKGSASIDIKEYKDITTWTEISLEAKKRGATGILSTHQQLLSKLTMDKASKIDDYAGSYFKRDELETVFLDPLKQLVTIPYGKFLTQRWMSKLIWPDRWMKEPKFSWETADHASLPNIYNRFADCDLISIDTETFKQNLAIRCVGYCGVWWRPDGIVTHTVVIPLTDLTYVSWMRKFNELPAPKVLQNGKYDHAYFFRYNAPVYNWLWDTQNCMHSWYSELPKTLGFLGPFFCRTGRYWKDLAETASNLEEYYLYNARDCHYTALSLLAWIKESPAWAKRNYLMKFKLNFPSHMGEMRGVLINEAKRAEQEQKLSAEILEHKASFERMTATPNINPNSPKQMMQLLTALGCKDLKGSGEKELKKAMYRHPLNSRILQKIIDVRERVKLKGTYLPVEKFLNGRLMYAVTPYATDTGRNNSNESAYWCGYNIQNIPAYTDLVKQYVEADEDFLFGEADFSQAESRGTGVLVGEEPLLAVFASGKDFHSYNAAAFFARDYDDIWDSSKGKTKDKPLRDLSKRVNHGANYLMGALVLWDTMGDEAVYKAARILQLPRFWTAVRICEYLLEQFEKTYPKIRKDHPDYVKAVVKSTSMLVGPTGWTRYTFLDPSSNKRHLNSLVAHRAQSLNAMILDEAVWNVFVNICLHPEHSRNFKYLAQIHDSIWFQYRKGHAYLAEMVRDCMKIPKMVEDINGIKRELIVPVDLKMGDPEVGARFWAEC